MAKKKAQSPPPEETIDEHKTLEIYKQALTFNVIAKYDPLIDQLVHLTSYCVVYRFDSDQNDWVKLDFQGPLAIYSRKSEVAGPTPAPEVVQNDQLYTFGLIVLNRIKPENFSIGLISSKQLTDPEDGIIVENTEKLIIVRDLSQQTYGLWIFDAADRDYICEILKYCIEGEQK
ncbi:hypothetical protein KL949_000179 [Ogataea haglerorum]|uniref:Uncharacterized protein n=1 Tax=Ogataea haglerorum TaxID=1937702 RepID=A0ABQ7RMR8_9ASCO|nr:uncharacterized protein KL911_001372 [Ogataea haglerorum]KAG7693368.1 hypothetical protein KL915_004267 [Ogataea haglerorum]KAG7694227.1 hypothetical protein KL951_004105 [Ogataea haglerorum]KAG7711948.1 hypothetical protein KL914_000590 [Ogataea haglerorum]KAG7722770.1 hypothetical protein KL913_000590 [Ogataea haglerorum]KAG7723129.1 hypothetical protein KL949_000179 [Ogataea haglerorum]